MAVPLSDSFSALRFSGYSSASASLASSERSPDLATTLAAQEASSARSLSKTETKEEPIYKPNTELTRKEPFPAGDDNEALNVLRVVGPSPTKTATVADWVGAAGGDAVIVTPAEEFGANQIMPLAIAQRDYSISKMPPEDPPPPKPPVPWTEQQSPEEAFASQEAAPAAPTPPPVVEPEVS